MSGPLLRVFAYCGSLALVLGVLAGCGQKGPLYISDDAGSKAEQAQGEEKSKPSSKPAYRF